MFSDLASRATIASAFFLNLAAGPTMLTAQQAPSEVPSLTIRANTRLVVVDVVVTDKKGRPVPGLKADDFTIEENGKTQRVSVFVLPGIAQPSAPTPTPAGVLSNHPENVIAAGIPTILLLDAANSEFKDQSYARSQMLKYVLEQVQTGRPMAVLTLTDRLRVLQEFTSDPQVLVTAIKNLKPEEKILRPTVPMQQSPSATDLAMTQMIATTPKERLALTKATASRLAVEDFANIQVAQYALERRTLITIEAMRMLARLLGGLPGRKNVVWLTSELPFDLIPEDRSVSDAELQADLPSVRQKSLSATAAGAVASQQREMHGREIREAETQLASANIAIYPVDLNGLISGMESSVTREGSHYADTGVTDAASSQVSGLQASHGTMEEVAAETGGKAYFNQNEIKDGITLAASDEKASYTLGYYPENKKWDGKLRTIKVKVSQGDIHLRYRKGYFALEPGTATDHNYEQDVAAALQVDAPATQISFRAQANPLITGRFE